MKVSIIYGTETGFTKMVAEDLALLFPVAEGWTTSVNCVDKATPEIWRGDLVILGAPTWCEPRLDSYGEYSDDWNDSYETFSHIDFKDQKVALFGLGDQVGYGNNFVDALGMMAEVVNNRGGEIIGKVSVRKYTFEKSEGTDGQGFFWGLPIDEDNEPTHTPQRLITWVEQLKKEMNE